MKIYLRRELLASEEEIGALLDTIRQQEELVHRLSVASGGAQLRKANHSEKLKELAARLKNGAHKAVDKAKLERKLETLKDEAPTLAQAVTDSAEKYQHALNELKELQNNFSDTYIGLDVVDNE